MAKKKKLKEGEVVDSSAMPTTTTTTAPVNVSVSAPSTPGAGAPSMIPSAGVGGGMGALAGVGKAGLDAYKEIAKAEIRKEQEIATQTLKSEAARVQSANTVSTRFVNESDEVLNQLGRPFHRVSKRKHNRFQEDTISPIDLLLLYGIFGKLAGRAGEITAYYRSKVNTARLAGHPPPDILELQVGCNVALQESANEALQIFINIADKMEYMAKVVPTQSNLEVYSPGTTPSGTKRSLGKSQSDLFFSALGTALKASGLTSILTGY